MPFGPARPTPTSVTRRLAPLVVTGLAATLLTGVVTSGSSVAAADSAATDPRFTLAWSKVLGGAGSAVALGSPGVGTLDSGGPSVIVGTRAGQLWAFHTGNGARPAGFPLATGAAVDSTPAVTGSGRSAQIYLGVGNSARPSAGGIAAYDAAGHRRWLVQPKALPTGGTAGVQTSVAIGRIGTATDVVGGSMGQLQYALSSGGGALPGFPWFQADSNFSSPALNDLNGDGHDEIIVGGDSTAGTAYGKTYSNGGHIRVVRSTGAAGRPQPWDGVQCDYATNQVVQSSPSVGRFLAGRGVGIVVGTGSYYAGASDTNAVFAVDPGCHLKWRAVLDGASLASPSLVDVDRNGTLEVVTASSHGSTGTLYVLDGTTGRTKWTAPISHGPIYGQVTSVDIAGRRSLLVGHPGGVTVYDAATGRVTGQLLQYVGVQNTVTVSVDPGNQIGVTVAGYNGQNAGVLYHFRLRGATATTVGAWGQWPMFHHDPALRGTVTGNP